LGRPEEALAQYREALRLNPQYEQARANLADLEARLGAAGR
jgi:tetratricopeptide (TPR) repeat protein